MQVHNLSMETIGTEMNFTGEDIETLDFPNTGALEVDPGGSAGSAVIMGTSSMYTNISHLSQDQIFPPVTMDVQSLANPFGQMGEMFDTLLSTTITRQETTVADQQAFALQPASLGNQFLLTPNIQTAPIINANIPPPPPPQQMATINIPILQAQGLKQIHVPGLPGPLLIRDLDKLMAEYPQLCSTATDPGLNIFSATLPTQQANLATIALPMGQVATFPNNPLQDIVLPERVDNQQQTDFIEDLEDETSHDFESQTPNRIDNIPDDKSCLPQCVDYRNQEPVTAVSDSLDSNFTNQNSYSMAQNVSVPTSMSLPNLEPNNQPIQTSEDKTVDKDVPHLTPTLVEQINKKLADLANQLKSGKPTNGTLPGAEPTVQFVISNGAPPQSKRDQTAEVLRVHDLDQDSKEIMDGGLDISKFLQTPTPTESQQTLNSDSNFSFSAIKSESGCEMSGFQSTSMKVQEDCGIKDVTVAVNSKNTMVLKFTLGNPGKEPPASVLSDEVSEHKEDHPVFTSVKAEEGDTVVISDDTDAEDVGSDVPDDGDDEEHEPEEADDMGCGDVESSEENCDDGDEEKEDSAAENEDEDVADEPEVASPAKSDVEDKEKGAVAENEAGEKPPPVLDLASPAVIRDLAALPSGVALSNLMKNKPNAPGRTDINVKIDESYCVMEDGVRRWKCSMCPKSYTTKHNLVTHVLDHSGIKPHCCMICGKFFKQVSHLNTHKLTHGSVKPHTCNVCGKAFTQISHMKRHLATHMEEKPHICDICSRGFAYPSELKMHKEKHARSTKCTCEDCGKTFSSMKKLQQHEKNSHQERTDLTCEDCGRTFIYPSQLKDHSVKHTGKRPYICGECGMDFMKEHHLRSHQFTHTGLRPYVCRICHRAFNQRANMQRHLLIHNPQKSFTCDVCDKKFAQPQTLKAHMVTHADQKPYSCKICGKTFGRLHNLQGHMHMHEESKPFVCFCGSSFTLRGNFNRHKKVKHGMKDTDEFTDEEAAQILNSMAQKKYDTEQTEDQSRDGDPDTSGDQERFDGAEDANTSGEGAGLLSPQKKKRKSVIPRKALKIDFSEMSVQGVRFTRLREGQGDDHTNGAGLLAQDQDSEYNHIPDDDDVGGVSLAKAMSLTSDTLNSCRQGDIVKVKADDRDPGGGEKHLLSL